MKKKRAIERLMKELNLCDKMEYYVVSTFGRMGCEENIDLDTYNCVRDYIRKELNTA